MITITYLQRNLSDIFVPDSHISSVSQDNSVNTLKPIAEVFFQYKPFWRTITISGQFTMQIAPKTLYRHNSEYWRSSECASVNTL